MKLSLKNATEIKWVDQFSANQKNHLKMEIIYHIYFQSGDFISGTSRKTKTPNRTICSPAIYN